MEIPFFFSASSYILYARVRWIKWSADETDEIEPRAARLIDFFSRSDSSELPARAEVSFFFLRFSLFSLGPAGVTCVIKAAGWNIGVAETKKIY